MSQINVNNIRAKDGVGPVGFPGGINATGVVTATTFSGNLTGNVTGAVTGNVTGNADTATSATVATNAQGLTGTPNINVGNVVAVDGTFSGNVSIAGTLTYNDVTNIDSIGIVTARDGIVADGFKVEEGNIIHHILILGHSLLILMRVTYKNILLQQQRIMHQTSGLTQVQH